MSLLEELKKANDHYQSEFGNILDSVNTTEKSLTRKQRKRQKLDQEGKDELARLVAFLEGATSSNPKKLSMSLKSGSLGKLISRIIIPMQHRRFLMEMTLSYFKLVFKYTCPL